MYAYIHVYIYTYILMGLKASLAQGSCPRHLVTQSCTGAGERPEAPGNTNSKLHEDLRLAQPGHHGMSAAEVCDA